LNDIREAVNQLKQEMSEIKKQVANLDNRVSALENDVTDCHFEEIEQMEEDSESTNSHETIEDDNLSENNTNDLRETQKQLDEKLNKMSDTMNSVLFLLGNTHHATPTNKSVLSHHISQ
jgi:chromosome segregation ATPase